MTGRYTPTDPVVRGAAVACPNTPEHPVISAIVGTNADLMKLVSSLWIAPDDIVLDMTYGKGVFWRNLNPPSIAHDIKGDGVDCRHLPEESSSVDVAVLDPPYRPTHGSKNFASGLQDAYKLGTKDLDSINDVLNLYRLAISEAHRVLCPGGRVLVKCQDLSYGHRLHLVTLDVLRLMTDDGFKFVDQFVLVNKTRLGSPRWKRQERARRSHSVMWVGVR